MPVEFHAERVVPALLAAMNGDGPFGQRLRAGLETISTSLEQQLEYDPAQDIEAIHAWFSAIGPSALGRRRKKTALFALCAVPEGICLSHYVLDLVRKGELPFRRGSYSKRICGLGFTLAMGRIRGENRAIHRVLVDAAPRS